MDITYKKLLATLDNVPCQNSEFIELNKYAMCSIWNLDYSFNTHYTLNKTDYDFFWGCMKIYDAYRVNYFMEYLKITSRYYGDFSRGINKWIQDFSEELMMSESEIIEYDYWFSTYCEYLEEICTTLKFFEFEHYGGVTLACLQTLLKEAPNQRRLKLNKIMQQHEVETQLRIESKIEKYFNFQNFSEKKFVDFVESCTTKHKNSSGISIDDAIKLAQEAPEYTYIVILSKAGKVIFAGKTRKLLIYLGNCSRKYEADSVFFEVVEENYASDVLFATILYFNLPLETVHITNTNRKYTTLKQACFAYRKSENIPRKEIQNAIRMYKVSPVITLPSDNIVYDKIELEKAVQKIRSRHI